jgi:predicted ester cyclase
MALERNVRVVLESFYLILSGDAEEAHRIIAADFVNREAEDDPEQPDRSLAGPAGFLATGAWLRSAFAELTFTDFEVIAEADRLAVRAVMTGRHVGEFQGLAPTGKEFRQRQMHFFRLRCGKVVEHAAQRDDLGLLLHLGWRPAAP